MYYGALESVAVLRHLRSCLYIIIIIIIIIIINSYALIYCAAARLVVQLVMVSDALNTYTPVELSNDNDRCSGLRFNLRNWPCNHQDKTHCSLSVLRFR